MDGTQIIGGYHNMQIREITTEAISRRDFLRGAGAAALGAAGVNAAAQSQQSKEWYDYKENWQRLNEYYAIAKLAAIAGFAPTAQAEEYAARCLALLREGNKVDKTLMEMFYQKYNRMWNSGNSALKREVVDLYGSFRGTWLSDYERAWELRKLPPAERERRKSSDMARAKQEEGARVMNWHQNRIMTMWAHDSSAFLTLLAFASIGALNETLAEQLKRDEKIAMFWVSKNPNLLQMYNKNKQGAIDSVQDKIRSAREYPQGSGMHQKYIDDLNNELNQALKLLPAQEKEINKAVDEYVADAKKYGYEFKK